MGPCKATIDVYKRLKNTILTENISDELYTINDVGRDVQGSKSPPGHFDFPLLVWSLLGSG